MSNTVKQLGFIPTNRGEYDTTGQTRYYKDNVVQYRNGSYICSPVGYSSSNPTAYTTDAPYQDGDTELNPNWELMASVGLVDEEPTAGSSNLVKSGGIKEELNKLDIKTNKVVDCQSISDFDVIDKNGNAIVSFVDGGIRTKNFDSDETKQKYENPTVTIGGKVYSPDIEDYFEGNTAVGIGIVDCRRFAKIIIYSSSYTKGLVTFYNSLTQFNSSTDVSHLTIQNETFVEYPPFENVNWYYKVLEVPEDAVGFCFSYSNFVPNYTIKAIPKLFANANTSDFKVSDENGNSVVIFKDGHVFTKEFDSSNISKKREYVRRNFFKVKVETSNFLDDNHTSVPLNTNEQTSFTEDNCVLYLPKNYNPSGTPTKIVLCCKPGGTYVTPYSDFVGDNRTKVELYLLHLGYALLAVDGMPDSWVSQLHLDESRVVGNYVAVQSMIRAFEYVKNNYNIDTENVFVYGCSQGGGFAQNLIDNSGINIAAAAEGCPVCSVRYHQWYLNLPVTLDGVTYQKAARLNIARIFGFPQVTTNSELEALDYNASKLVGYDMWVRNVDDVYNGFVQNSGTGLWHLPSGTSIDDITMKKYSKCPLKIWCAENDNILGVDIMKTYIKAIKNSGQVADIQVYTTGYHEFFTNQYNLSNLDTFTENGNTYKIIPFAKEVAIWFFRFGGYDNN